MSKVVIALGGIFLGLLVLLGTVNFVDRMMISLQARPLFTTVINSDDYRD